MCIERTASPKLAVEGSLSVEHLRQLVVLIEGCSLDLRGSQRYGRKGWTLEVKLEPIHLIRGDNL